MKNLTTEDQRKAVQELIQTELLKRGFTAAIKRFEETENRSGSNYLSFATEKFQTTPVIFKEIQVDNFSSSLSQEEKTNDAGTKFIVTKFWISVHVSYRHFGGGTNGCELFQISGKFYDDNDHTHYTIK